MSIKNKIAEDMKAALKAQDKDRLQAIRNLHGAIRKKEIDDRVELDDEGVFKIISSLIKQRQDSIEQFKKGSRLDLVEKETKELEVLKSYLPAQLSKEEVEKLVDEAISEAKASTQKDMGAVMKILMPKVSGRADGKLVSQIVTSKLSK
jgi:hypothetical protein